MNKLTSEPLLTDIVPLLNEITKKLGDLHDPSALYNTITKICRDRFQAEASSLFIEEEPGGDTINMVAGQGYSENIVNQAPYKKHEGITGNVWAFGEPFKADNHEELITHQWFRGKWDKEQWKEEKKCDSIIVVPLLIGQRAIGILKVENKIPVPSAFSSNEYNILQTIASVVSLAVENARLAERSHNMVLDTLQTTVEALSGIESYFPTSLYGQIVVTCRDIFNATAASLYLESPDRTKLTMVAGEGYSKVLIGQEYSRKEGITGHVWSEGASVKIDNVKSLKEHPWHQGKYDPQQWKDGQYCWSLLAVPLKIRDHIIGVLKVEGRQPEPAAFKVSEQRLLEMIASIVALSVHNEISVRRLQEVGAHAYEYVHDSKNDLYTLRLSIESLQRDIPVEIHPQVDSRLFNMFNLIEDMQRYAKDILILSKQSNPILEALRLSTIYGYINAHWGSSLKHRDIILLNELNLDDVFIVVDKTMLYFILSNLIQNAIDAVTLKQTNKPEYLGAILLFAVANKDEVYIYICDNALGIASDNLPKLFEDRFTTKPHGNGLGLFIVKDYVKQNRGSINYCDHPPLELLNKFPNHTDPWKTVFHITFPRGEKDKLYYVLIVDDSGPFVEQMRFEFSRRPAFADLEWAKNGAEAITCIKSKDYDVIILDMYFNKPPGGKTIYKNIRNEGYKGKVIITSGHEDLIEEAHQLQGVADVIPRINANSIPERCERLLGS